MALDPIVSLSVALAEAPGTCAFFLGSGVSRDAGVPTGGEVRRQGLHRLRQVELGTTDQVSDDELAEWLEESGHGDLSYSELLQLIAPDAAVRREYLAKYFEGVEPAQTHEALADLAVRGVVSVFVTTNFDRLLEHALLARGIEPVVVSSDAELAAAVPREHASCVVIKPHGDYLQQTIRNTSAELAELEPRMTRELAEVFERYGLVVLGYSGSDEGVNNVLKQRRSRYGLWWVARSAPNDAAGALIGGLGGRVVRRESAADFLADLNGRLAVFEQHPSGKTPAVVHDQTLALLRAGDAVGLEELLRAERHEWRSALSAAQTLASSQSPSDVEAVRQVWTGLEPALQRRLASLLPLVLHAPDALQGEMVAMGRGSASLPDGGYVAWQELSAAAATWLGYVLGAVIVRCGEWKAARSLLEPMRWDALGRGRPLVLLMGSAVANVGQAMAPPNERSGWLSPFWEYMTRSLADRPWIAERYPELGAEGEPRASMSLFDLLVCINAARQDAGVLPHFDLTQGVARRFARQMRGDADLRKEVAGAVGFDLESFDENAPGLIRGIRGFQRGLSDHGDVADDLEGR